MGKLGRKGASYQNFAKENLSFTRIGKSLLLLS
jgi:hypothetical protein